RGASLGIRGGGRRRIKLECGVCREREVGGER
ncbi:hypothetical protein CSUI_004421, partial [Cystoisospora suis]